jgi:hypothetical protein
MTDTEAYARIGQFIESHQSDTYSEIGRHLALSRSQVARIARLRGIKRGPGKRSAALRAAVAIIDAATAQPGCASEGEVATLPTEEPISAAPDAPPAGEVLSATPDTPLAEIAVA